MSINGADVSALPDEVRCLPGVVYGSVIQMSPDSVPTTGKMSAAMKQLLVGRQLEVQVAPGATPAQSLGLCQELMRMGYGPGGRHGITVLSVSGDFQAGGTYISAPGKAPCAQ